MALTDYLLYQLARRWPSPLNEKARRLGAEPGTEAYERAYCQDQFDRKVRSGLTVPVTGMEVLEIGCGNGGISCFLAVAGAKRVVGIDLEAKKLDRARAFAAGVAGRFGPGCELPVSFEEMSAYALTLPEASFDLVVADNSFEHFLEPEKVLQQAFRVLRPGGGLLVPVFSSIYSQYGLHLKYGLKLPWANLFFSEKTILRALHRLAKDDPRLLDFYPGLANNPQRVRDVRPYGDLNDITYGKFRRMARRTGFELSWFRPFPTRLGVLVARLPLLRHTLLMDVFSQGAGAYLKKPPPLTASRVTAGGGIKTNESPAFVSPCVGGGCNETNGPTPAPATVDGSVIPGGVSWG
jgi:ubiquinone/menaquinone biosynthesis C-methylase UbiE